MKVLFVLTRKPCQIWNETSERAIGAAKAVRDIYEFVTHQLLTSDLRYGVFFA